MASRFLQKGARLVCLPEMVGYYVPRDSLPALARQYYRYGFFRARTFRCHPQSMRRSHLIPPTLALALVGAVIAPRTLRRASRLGLTSYALAVGATAVRTAARAPQHSDGALLLAVLPAMQLGWGFGTLAGASRFGLPVEALRVLAGWPARPTDGHRAKPVYAPSLSGVDA
jgi:hypothetical protein